MKFVKCLGLVALLIVPVFATSASSAQTETQKDNPKSATASSETEEKNLQVYIDLLRKNVRQDKAEIMGAIMALSAADASKFWPIYNDYDAELSKLNDLRVANIKEYAQNYDQMTNEKADELIQNALTYQKQRAELLGRTYDRVKQALGAVTAARFAQVENQLLLIIDLRIDSSLPIVGPSS